MKRFIFILFIAFFVISTRGEQWKGKVYVKDGVKIIENGETGFITNKNIKFKDTLSIGKEEGEDYLMFSGQNLDLAVSDDGSIYIFDGKKYKLLKFDKNGKFLWQIGRKGEGPEDFKSEYSQIYSAPSNRIIVAEPFSSLLKLFDSQGRYIKTIKLNKEPSYISFTDDKRMFVNIFMFGQPKLTAAFYTPDGKFISKFPIEYKYGPKLPSGVGVSLSSGEIKTYGKKVLMSLPDKYEIREYNLKGELKRIIKRKVKLSPPNIKVFNGGRGVTVYPSDVSGPPFLYKNRLLINKVIKVKKAEKNKYITTKYLDFFNREGKYLGSYKLPEGTDLKEIDPNGNFYFIQKDPFPKVFRAKLLFDF